MRKTTKSPGEKIVKDIKRATRKHYSSEEKIMAMEGHFESHPEGWAPLYLFGIPNDAKQRLDYALGIPGLGNLIFEKPLDKPVMGLDTIPDEEQPPVGIVFWSFRVMVGLGFLMLGLGAWSTWSRWKGTLYDAPWLHRACIVMGPSGFVAVLAGWITTEVGRQPYTVYGLLRTSDSLAPIDAPAVAASLIAFIIVYFFVFGAGTFYILQMMNKRPSTPKLGLADGPIRTAGITPAPQIDNTFIPGE